jgi:hypothetical protein
MVQQKKEKQPFNSCTISVRFNGLFRPLTCQLINILADPAHKLAGELPYEDLNGLQVSQPLPYPNASH